MPIVLIISNMLHDQSLRKFVIVSTLLEDFTFWVILFKNTKISHIIGSSSEFLYQQ
jgi:hypothetical protein